MTKYVKVKIINNKINQSFTYMIDLSLYKALEYGDLVLVKFNSRFQIAFYIEDDEELNNMLNNGKISAKDSLKLEMIYPILKVLKTNRIKEYAKELINYMYENTFNAKEDIANMLVSKNEIGQNKLEIKLLQDLNIVDEYLKKYLKEGNKLSNKQYLSDYFKESHYLYKKIRKEHFKLIEYLYNNKVIDIVLATEDIKKIKVYYNDEDKIYLKRQEYIKKYELTTYKFNKLRNSLHIKEKEISTYEYVEDRNYEQLKQYQLTDYQRSAYEKIEKAINNKPVLLRGITGSGKTSVFINLIEKYIEDDKQILLLVPEMILAKQLINIIYEVFGNVCGYYSNNITIKEKDELLNKIKIGKIKIVVGTRSSVFLEIPKLSLVIVDEEHDNSYKQNFYPYYDVHDLIDFYSNKNIHVLLSSATPLISTYARAQKEVYELVELTRRYNDYSNANIIFRNYDKDNLINGEFITYVSENLERDEKILILFNIKGYSKTVECSCCYDIVTCPNCNIPLKYYKESNSCECSYCDYKIVNYTECQKCGSTKINYLGLGIEKVEDELNKCFEGKVLRIDSKIAKTKQKINQIIDEFNGKEAKILLGTQIISKGLNFTNLNKVIVLNLDNMLYFDDFAAYEKAYQLVEQVSGRSGRNKEDGEVIIYTNHSDNYVYKSVFEHDYNKFYDKEMINRKLQKSVPYYYIAQIEYRYKDKKECKRVINEIKEYLKINYTSLIVTNVIQPYIVKIGEDYRLKIYIKYKNEDIRSILKECIEKLGMESLKILIDLKIVDYGY